MEWHYLPELPQECGRYLVTTADSEVYILDYGYVDKDVLSTNEDGSVFADNTAFGEDWEKNRDFCSICNAIKVIAWMPLPEAARA